MPKHPLLLTAAVAAAVFASPLASAQEFPTKPVRVLVGYAAGSGSDVLARQIADGLSKQFGQPFLIENRPGAAASVAADALSKSPGDGYTQSLLGGASLTINMYIEPKPVYDPLKDFTPINLLVENDAVLIVSKDSPIRTLRELIDQAKRTPGGLSMGSTGGGTPTRLGVELLKKAAGVELTDIFYPAGDTRGALDVMNGNLPVYLAALISVVPQVRSGQVRAIAMLGPRRVPDFPDVPTAIDQGLPGFTVQTWLAWVGPAGVPKPIVDRMNGAIRRVMNEPENVKRMAAQGSRVANNTPEEFAQLIRADLKKWGDIVPQLKLTQ